MRVSEFEILFDDFVRNIYNKKPQKYSKHLQGISPDQIWEKTYINKKDVSKEEPDKDRMSEMTDEALSQVDAVRKIKDEFFCQANKEEINKDLLK